MSYAARLKEHLSKRNASYWGEVAAARLAKAGAAVKVPLPELLAWYAADLDAIENDPELTDTKLLLYVEDYATRHRAKGVGVCA